MKKIWIWNHYATEMYKNSGGRHYWIAKNLKENYEPTIFCANTFHNSNEKIETSGKKFIKIKLNEIPFIFVKTVKSNKNGIRRVLNMVVFFFNLMIVASKYKKSDGKPDVIIASSVHPLTMVAGILMARKFKIVCICEVRDLWPEAIFFFTKVKEKSIVGKLLLKVEYWIYKNADKIVFTKEGDVDYILEKGWDSDHGGAIDLSKCFYINNGIDLVDYKQNITKNILDDEDLLTENKFKVIYCGAIRPVNNVGNIVECAELLKNNSEIVFLIYGDGNELLKLKQLAMDKGLTNIVFKGHVNKKYIPYILSKSSLNILNYSQSQYNWSRGNSSNKLFEYMASGKPIVSTVKMGYCLLTKYDCGVTLEENTPEKLASKIVDIQRLPKKEYEKMSNNSIEAAKDFDFKVLTKKYASIIEMVL
ncbi:glycosyltransferase family 4 protein [Carnobacterium divergens]|uniref:glycosyltransferase family 4 protein n=1 Tax=Carnobacterium divergens TaxID=2748 RepID=UPI0039B08CA6